MNRTKAEYLCLNGDVWETMRLLVHEMAEVDEPRYLGSRVQGKEDCGREVKGRVQAGWYEWRKVPGVKRDISARANGKVYKTAVVRYPLWYRSSTTNEKTGGRAG